MSDAGAEQPKATPPTGAQSSADSSSSPPISRSAVTADTPLWQRIKRHKVAEWSLAYIAFGYACLHGSEMVREALGWSALVPRLTLLTLLLGFPVVVTLAWYHGHRAKRRMSGSELLIVSLLLAIGGTVLWGFNRPHSGVADKTSEGSVAPSNSVSEKSIAVLPFLDLSEKHDEEYFSDGLSEELIDMLAQIPDLRVPARTSSFYFKGKSETVPTIAHMLGVANVLEGSVRKDGNQLRVTAQLIRADGGYHLWSETYDRELKDLFTVQDEIASAVVSALKLKLVSGQQTASASVQTDRPQSGSLEAYNAVLEGKYYLARNTNADTRIGIERFSRATELDPRYAYAWSLLSRAWTSLGAYHINLAKTAEAYAQARAATNMALSLAPDLAGAHLARGYLLENADLDWRAAEAEYRRAFELAPGNGEAAASLARQLANFGQVNRAIDLTKQALASDPLNSTWHGWLANYFCALNRLDEAKAAIERAIELQPGSVRLHLVLTEIEIQRGRSEDALVAAQQEPIGSFFRDAALAEAVQATGNRRAADAALRTLLDKGPSWDPYDVAATYAMRNDPDKTFEWLERAWSYRDPAIHNLPYDPFIGRYKHDPRFAAYCQKVGLPVPGGG